MSSATAEAEPVEFGSSIDLVQFAFFGPYESVWGGWGEHDITTPAANPPDAKEAIGDAGQFEFALLEFRTTNAAHSPRGWCTVAHTGRLHRIYSWLQRVPSARAFCHRQGVGRYATSHMDYFGCKNLFQRRSCGETSADLSTKAQEQRKIKGLLNQSKRRWRAESWKRKWEWNLRQRRPAVGYEVFFRVCCGLTWSHRDPTSEVCHGLTWSHGDMRANR